MSRGQAGRADLVRALVVGESLQLQLAEQLGFDREVDRVDRTKDEPPAQAISSQPGERVSQPGEARPGTLHFQPCPVTFWLAEAFRVRTVDSEDISADEPRPEDEDLDEEQTAEGTDTSRDATGDQDPALIFDPLAPTADVITRLRRLTEMKRAGREVDIDRLVDEISRGRQPQVVPRKMHRAWGAGLHVITDLSRRLVPYKIDQGILCRSMQRLLNKSDATFASVGEHHKTPRTYWPEQAAVPWSTPHEGATVLVLGDLGALAEGDVDVRRRWLEFGNQLANERVQRIALVPCLPDEIPHELKLRWTIVSWERLRAGAARYTPVEQQARVDRLVALLTLAIAVEPQLLRRVRRTLPQCQSDPGIEARVWQHGAFSANNCEGATFDVEQLEPLIAARRRESEETTKAVLECVRRYHAGRYEGAWYGEILAMGRDAQRLLDGSELRRARQWFQAIERDENPDGQRNELYRMLQPFLTGEAESCEPVLQRLFARNFGHDRGTDPTATFDPQLLPPDVDDESEAYRVAISQWNGSFEFTRNEARRATTLASPIASVNTRTSRLRFDHLDRAADTSNRSTGQAFLDYVAQLPLDHLPRPTWATDFGRDEFGLYADLQVTSTVSAKRGKATQRLRLIPPGTFRMGSPSNEHGRFDNEGPQHQVTISEAFWLFDSPCTQAFWHAVTGIAPSQFKGNDRPVESVSWQDVQQFMERLTEQTTGMDVQLPTEAQWEYACRAGSTTATYAGDLHIEKDRAPELEGIAWYWGNRRDGTQPVKQKQPNDWGLYDTLGNVWEWCHDGLRPYAPDAVTDPVGPKGASADRVIRGGSSNRDARRIRAASRVAFSPVYRYLDLGFRCRVQARELQQAVEASRQVSGVGQSDRPGCRRNAGPAGTGGAHRHGSGRVALHAGDQVALGVRDRSRSLPACGPNSRSRPSHRPARPSAGRRARILRS